MKDKLQPAVEYGVIIFPYHNLRLCRATIFIIFAYAWQHWFLEYERVIKDKLEIWR